MTYRQINVERELALDTTSGWDAAALSRWLDRSTPQADVPQPIFLEYCRRLVEGLSDRIDLDQLVRGKFALRRAIQGRVRELRAEAGQHGVQMILGEIAPVLQLGENGFTFSKAGYDPRNAYEGPWRPVRHLFAQVGDLKHGGEEWQFATMLDTHSQVELWVRNVDRTPYSYWLPTSTDRFYPDFVAKLNDGRILVAEYKGADRADSADSLEKKNIGERVEEVSAGKLRFLWATQPSLPSKI